MKKNNYSHSPIAWSERHGWSVPGPFALVTKLLENNTVENTAYVFGKTEEEAIELAKKIARLLNEE